MSFQPGDKVLVVRDGRVQSEGVVDKFYANGNLVLVGERVQYGPSGRCVGDSSTWGHGRSLVPQGSPEAGRILHTAENRRQGFLLQQKGTELWRLLTERSRTPPEGTAEQARLIRKQIQDLLDAEVKP